jgi:hypothetical protein
VVPFVSPASAYVVPSMRSEPLTAVPEVDTGVDVDR